MSQIQTIQQMIQNKISSYQYPDYFFEPLKISFILGSGVFLSYPWIAFDGLISHLFAEEILGPVFRLIPLRDPMDFVDNINIPLKKTNFINKNNTTDYVYNASISFFSNPEAVSTQTLHRTFNSENCVRQSESEKKKIDIVRGQYKLYSMKIPVNYSSSCVFYCNGDRKILEILCEQIQGLGKHRAAGGGNVVSYKIESIDEDISIVDRNGKIMRALPVEFCQQHNINVQNKVKAQLSYKPPFWAKMNNCLCIAPEYNNSN
jgi:CRISPR type IV-associated protein Csf3